MEAPGAEEISRRLAGPGNGIAAAAGASLEVTLGRIAASLARRDERDRRLREAQSLHPVPIMGALTASGTFDQADRLGPHDGYWWDVRRIALDGFTAGSVSLYRNDVNGTKLAQWTQPGEWTWSGAQWLAPRDRFLFVAASITGNVTIDGHAIEVSTQALVDYIL